MDDCSWLDRLIEKEIANLDKWRGRAANETEAAAEIYDGDPDDYVYVRFLPLRRHRVLLSAPEKDPELNYLYVDRVKRSDSWFNSIIACPSRRSFGWYCVEKKRFYVTHHEWAIDRIGSDEAIMHIEFPLYMRRNDGEIFLFKMCAECADIWLPAEMDYTYVQHLRKHELPSCYNMSDMWRGKHESQH
jgi:hypothetical protein